MIPPFELRFSKSSSCYYADAVRLAAALPNYEELRDGHRREHICRFGTTAGRARGPPRALAPRPDVAIDSAAYSGDSRAAPEAVGDAPDFGVREPGGGVRAAPTLLLFGPYQGVGRLAGPSAFSVSPPPVERVRLSTGVVSLFWWKCRDATSGSAARWITR
jgi:hypothetical protein